MSGSQLPRWFAAHLVCAVIFLALVSAAGAQEFPSRPVRLIVPFPAGGSADLLGRALAKKMSEGLGQQVVVENRAGAGGNLAANAVAKSAPDGYTLLVSFTSHTINATLYPNLPFDPVGSGAGDFRSPHAQWAL